METIAHWLADPTTRTLYLVVALAVMIVPMIVLALWYHGKIGADEGGRRLMEDQAANAPTPRWAGNPSRTVEMARDIAGGAYGEHARRMQIKVYWLVGAWIIANIIVFGVLLWADEINRVATSTGS